MELTVERGYDVVGAWPEFNPRDDLGQRGAALPVSRFAVQFLPRKNRIVVGSDIDEVGQARSRGALQLPHDDYCLATTNHYSLRPAR